MQNRELISKFTNQYSLSKTLRFELIPQGKTLHHIREKGFLKKDESRAESYKRMKKIIDEYHKDFIEKALRNIELKGLDEYVELYKLPKRDDSQNKSFEAIKTALRKQIAETFSKSENVTISNRFKNLFQKELIKIDLKNWVNEEDKALVEEFDNFTTYFTGFHENRKNIYTGEEISTAIAFRLVHQNLPKFIDNISIFEKAVNANIDFSAIDKDMDEVLQGTSLNEIFSLGYFNKILNQTGIDLYNFVLGGKSEKDQKKIKGINEYINLYNQQQTDRKQRIPKLKPLYKQILSDRNSLSFLAEQFENDNELLEAIEQFRQTGLLHYKTDLKEINVLNEWKTLIENLNDFQREGVYVNNGIVLTDISQQLFGSWEYLKKALVYYYENVLFTDEKEKKKKKYNEAKEKWLKQKQFSIAVLEDALAAFKKQETNPEILEKFTEHPVIDYFKKAGNDGNGDLPEKIDATYNTVKDLLNTSLQPNEKLVQQKDKTLLIKNYLDSIVNLLHFIKSLKPREELSQKDEAFYGRFDELYEALNVITPLYNKVRNHLTKKPYSTEKYKLNFENSTLADGWDLNKEADNTTILLRKEGNYYVAVMDKKHNKIFRDIPASAKGEAVYEKMVYKLLPGANKMLPKVFFSKSRIEEFNPSTELLENYKNETHKKGESFNIQHCYNLINFFKSSICQHEDWKHFNFNFSETGTYEDLSGFYREVEHQGYKITFVNISESYIHKLVEEGKLYLFQLYNKDFSKYSKGKPNLHTLYWKMLFDETNLKDVVYKLNGEAEVFYRKKSIEDKNKIIHKANQPISNKNPENVKKQSSFQYDITKDHRFTKDKFQFHVPITMNFKAKGILNVNNEANKYLRNNPDTHIIGIDRGERHLLYLTLINQQGEIIKQESLNIVANEKQKTDYHKLLEAKEGKRDEARRDWGTIENIKELKEGYLSQVVHKIAEMIVDYNAIVVMEDLNFGFKRGRQKVEKQVYQKFEKMLIDKLNYLVFKTPKPNQPGLLNALQLANKFESFKKLGKQSGFIFYVPAWNTSKMDPVTGFVDFLKPKYESVDKAIAFIKQFDAIQYNKAKQYFEFVFDYSNFTEKAEGSKTKWTVCTTNTERYVWNKTLNNGKGGQEHNNVTEKLEVLFGNAGITYGNGENIISKITEQTGAEFYKALLKLLSITVSLRHNNGEEGEKEQDYILSPVAPFFDSRKATDTLPKNADANGAYHIAKKGLWVLEQINKCEDFKKLKLAISNKEWLEFVQKSSIKTNYPQPFA